MRVVREIKLSSISVKSIQGTGCGCGCKNGSGCGCGCGCSSPSINIPYNRSCPNFEPKGRVE